MVKPPIALALAISPEDWDRDRATEAREASELVTKHAAKVDEEVSMIG